MEVPPQLTAAISSSALPASMLRVNPLANPTVQISSHNLQSVTYVALATYRDAIYKVKMNQLGSVFASYSISPANQHYLHEQVTTNDRPFLKQE